MLATHVACRDLFNEGAVGCGGEDKERILEMRVCDVYLVIFHSCCVRLDEEVATDVRMVKEVQEYVKV